MAHVIKSVSMVHKTDGNVKVDVYRYGRKAHGDIYLEILVYKGKRITPFENRLRGLLQYTFQGLFRVTYEPMLDQLILGDRLGLIRHIPKGSWIGSRYPTPKEL